MAVIALPYYRATNLVISANARHVIGEVLAAQAGWLPAAFESGPTGAVSDETVT